MMVLKNTGLMALCLAIALISCAGNDNKKQLPPADTIETKANLASSDTSSQLMKEDDFWELITKARGLANNNYEAQKGTLKLLLLPLDATAIEQFNNRFTSLLAASYDYKLWGASYVINGGCSDDCFDYFRQYLIGHGKARFYQALKDPDSCAGWIKSEEEDNWEGLQYAAFDAYKQKTGKDIPKSYKPTFTLKGKPFKEETVMKQYPKLAKKVYGG